MPFTLLEEVMETRVEEANEEEQENNESLNRFKRLLEEYDFGRPRRGQILKGEIISIQEDMILVDVGAKRDAVIPQSEVSKLDRDFLEKLSPGDKIPVYVYHTGIGDEDLLVSLERGLVQEEWNRALEYLNQGEVVELSLVGYNKGGALVEFGRLQGFVPNSHLTAIRRGATRHEMESVKSRLVGTRLQGKILEVDQSRGRLVLSQREAEAEQRVRRLRQLEKGMVLTRNVVNIVDFGAFVDLDGVDGLVHISELAWERIGHPSEVVNVGDEIEVEVLDVDVERQRISLSRKARLPSPWDRLQQRYKVGDLVEGTVTNVRNFGAFVELTEGVVGLIRANELGFAGLAKPREVVKPGDKVLARILEIKPKKERISLSMRRVTYEEQIAWMLEYTGETEKPSEETPIRAAFEEAVSKEPSQEVSQDREENAEAGE